MKHASSAAVGLCVALLCAGAAIMLVPLQTNGVTGSALLPHYHAFSVTTFQPLPRHLTLAALRRAGVRLPQDAVAHRRYLAAAFLAGADVAGLVTAALLLTARRPGATAVTATNLRA